MTDRIVEYEVKGNLTITDALFSVEVALERVGLAYAFEQLACFTSRPSAGSAYRLFFADFCQSIRLKALIDFAERRRS